MLQKNLNPFDVTWRHRSFDQFEPTIYLARLSTYATSKILGHDFDLLQSREFERVQATSSVTHCISGLLGPILLSVYTSPHSQLARIYNISIQQYADDTLFYLALSTSVLPTARSICRLERRLSSLHAWFRYIGMCLNPAKSVVTLPSASQCLRSFPVVQFLCCIYHKCKKKLSSLKLRVRTTW